MPEKPEPSVPADGDLKWAAQDIVVNRTGETCEWISSVEFHWYVYQGGSWVAMSQVIYLVLWDSEPCHWIIWTLSPPPAGAKFTGMTPEGDYDNGWSVTP